GASIVEMSGSTSGLLILDSENRVWTWGGPFDRYSGKSPVLVDTTGLDSAKVVAISAGEYVNILADDQGRIWGWGQNETGGLGSSKIGFVSSRDPVLLGTNQFVEAVATNSGGDRYAYAYNFAYGQDVILWWGQSNLPTKLNTGFLGAAKIKKVEVSSANPSRAFILDTHSHLWRMGMYESPEKVDLSPLGSASVVDIDAGVHHQLILDDTNQLWVVNSYADGSYGDIERVDLTPMGDAEVVSFSAGDLGFSLILDSAGNVWGWGDNSWGQLGDGSYVDSDSLINIGNIYSNEVSVDIEQVSDVIPVRIGENRSISVANVTFAGGAYFSDPSVFASNSLFGFTFGKKDVIVPAEMTVSETLMVDSSICSEIGLFPYSFTLGDEQGNELAELAVSINCLPDVEVRVQQSMTGEAEVKVKNNFNDDYVVRYSPVALNHSSISMWNTYTDN